MNKIAKKKTNNKGTTKPITQNYVTYAHIINRNTGH